MANLILLGLISEGVGTILLAALILLVHHRVKKEHGIDVAVIRDIKIEEGLGIVSIALLVIGFILQMIAIV